VFLRIRIVLLELTKEENRKMKIRKKNKAMARLIKRTNWYNDTMKNVQNPTAFTAPGSMKK